MDINQLLKRLCDMNAPTGFEMKASAAIKELMVPWCEKVWVDSFYNVIGFIKGLSDNPKKIMVTAHYDQIGMIVSDYEENGFLRIVNLGGIDTKALLACEVMIHGKEDLYGIIGAKPPHLLTEKEVKKNIKITEMLIDTGLSDTVLKEKVTVGDPVSIATPAVQMTGGCLCGKSIDNRCGVAAMIKTMEKLQRRKQEEDVYFVATVQEEVQLLGAVTASYGIDPQLALVIDACHGDMPETDKEKTFELGRGIPVSTGPAFHRQETGKLLEIAKRERIPTQISVEPGDPGTEAWAIQISRLGIPTLEVSIPVRYMHTGSEVVQTEDIEMTASLVSAYIAEGSREEDRIKEGGLL